jgi:5-hydroxyisourate hydrolase
VPTFSTHVLDVATGQPAPGVEVTLSPIRDSSDSPTFRALTDSNGRITDGLGGVLDAGVWRATFALGPYFSQRAMPGCIVSVEVTLLLNEERHYHVPLLATPNSATSYLGT